MLSKTVQDLLQELDRLEYLDVESKKFNQDTPVVNGVSGTQGIDFYVRKIDSMYEAFLNEIGEHDFTDLITVKQALQKSITKQNNYYKIEEYQKHRMDFEYNGDQFPLPKQLHYRQIVPILQLFEDVYFKQFDILAKAEKTVRELLIQKDPNSEAKFDPNFLFNLFPKADYNRIVQRLVITLQNLKLIDPNFGGNAENFKLLFDKYNPKFKQPERIRWNGEYDQLAFFILTIKEKNLILDEANAAINHYSKACMWFTDRDGKTFSQCGDPKKRRYTGRKEKFALFRKQIISSIDRAEN